MNRKKKSSRNVLVVINIFESAENFVGGQFKYLTENGYKMHLICSDDPKLSNFAKEQGIEYEAITLNRQLTPWQDLKSLFRICKYIKRNKIDTVIGHQVKGRLLSMIASLITGVPNKIIFAHGAIFETSKGFKRNILIWESRIESFIANKVICVSNYIMNLRIENKIDKPSKQIILGAGTCGGIDTVNRFNPELISEGQLKSLKLKYGIYEQNFVIGFVGRLVRDKGVVELINAFEILKKRNKGKSIKLMIVGEPEKRDGLPAHILKALQFSTDIIYTGRIAHDDMAIQYLCMDCLVLPSYREGFGFCNIEAQAMGIPVLTTSITGCRDSIVDGKTGLYIKLEPIDIADKIELLFNDKKRRHLGQEAREWVDKNFDHTQIWPHVKYLLQTF